MKKIHLVLCTYIAQGRNYKNDINLLSGSGVLMVQEYCENADSSHIVLILNDCSPELYDHPCYLCPFPLCPTGFSNLTGLKISNSLPLGLTLSLSEQHHHSSGLIIL